LAGEEAGYAGDGIPPTRNPSTKKGSPVTKLALAKVHRIAPVSARRNVKLTVGEEARCQAFVTFV